MPNLSILGLVLDTFPDGRVAGWSGGRSGGEWIIVLSSAWLGSELGKTEHIIKFMYFWLFMYAYMVAFIVG